MTRTDHLKWCKERAVAALKSDGIPGAWASMVSDMSKHAETQNHVALELGNMMLMSGQWKTPADVEKFIDGFN